MSAEADMIEGEIAVTAPTTPRFDAAYLAWNTVASHDSQEQAQATVERLSAQGFPVEHLDIVGSDLRMVERVTGRITRGKVVLAGASQGIWMGLFVGLLMSLFGTGVAVAASIISAMIVGAAVGAVLALVTRSALRQPRGFASVRTFVAARYDIVARDGFAEQAREALQRSDAVTL